MSSPPRPAAALVLAAGFGTRLRPLTRVRAKPAVPLAGEPMIRRIVGWLGASGVTDVVVNLHHLPETIAAVLGDGTDLSVRVRYSWEQPIVLGSAGGPRKALDILDGATLLIVNGDTLTDVDVAALAADHADSGAMVTLALVPNTEPTRYGGVRLDDGCVVTGFVRRGPEAAGSWHFVGVQMTRQDVFRDLPADVPLDSIGGVYDELLGRRPGAIRGFRCEARFLDVGTADDYWNAHMAFASGPGVHAGRHLKIAAGATVSRTIVWDDVDVGPDCRIEDCILTDRVQVPAGSVFENAIVRADDGGPLEAGERRAGGLVVSERGGNRGVTR